MSSLMVMLHPSLLNARTRSSGLRDTSVWSGSAANFFYKATGIPYQKHYRNDALRAFSLVRQDWQDEVLGDQPAGFQQKSRDLQLSIMQV